MKAKFNLLLLAAFLLTSFAYAQNPLVSSNDSKSRQVQQLSWLTTGSQNNNSSYGNNITVQQVGNYNQLNSVTHSDNSTMNVLQLGNKNNIDLEISAFSINENVMQLGESNTFLNYSTESAVHGANVIQQGANQTLLMTGSNSISESLLVNMRGNSQTVIIRNIK